MTVQVNRPSVVSQEFDGEGVIVHLGTGVYYSLDPRGTTLWERIEGDASIDDLVRDFCAEHDVALDEARRTVLALIRQLVDESLVTVTDELDSPDQPPTNPIALERFSDLQDVLLVDPIHDLDLDGDGWPIDRGSGVGRPTGS